MTFLIDHGAKVDDVDDESLYRYSVCVCLLVCVLKLFMSLQYCVVINIIISEMFSKQLIAHSVLYNISVLFSELQYFINN